MKKYKAIVLRSQYQTVVVDAEHYEQAIELACESFDESNETQEFIEAYDVQEASK